MKILSGKFRGRNIVTIPDGSFRPTSDKIRQAIFNALQGRIDGMSVLDLYAGSGSIAFEALSNGASSVCCVEADKKRCRLITQTASSMKVTAESCQVLCSDVSVAIQTSSIRHSPFELIYLDPPYDEPIKIDDIQRLIQGGYLNEGGRFIIETRKHHSLEYVKHIDFMTLLKQRKYGGTVLLEYTV